MSPVKFFGANRAFATQPCMAPGFGPASLALAFGSQLGLIALHSALQPSTTTTTTATVVCPSCPVVTCECPPAAEARCPSAQAPVAVAAGPSWNLALLLCGLCFLAGIGLAAATVTGLSVLSGFLPGLALGAASSALSQPKAVTHDGADAQPESSIDAQPQSPVPLCW